MAAAVPGWTEDSQTVFKGVPGTTTSSATINVREAIARQRLMPRTTAEQSPEAARSPMPIPDMPPADRVAAPRDIAETQAAGFPELTTAQAPSLTAGFLALGDANSSIPPDTHGAAGPAHLMVTLNTQIRYQDKTGAILGTLGLNGFWSARNGGSGAFDPRVTYDQLAGRWVTVACDDQFNGGLLVGVSRNSDPTGTWDLFRIPAGAGLWADFPTLGFNKNWVALQVNIFTNTTNLFVESRVYAINRSQLYGGPPATLSYSTITLTAVSGTQVPAVTHDPTLALEDLYLLQAWSSVGGQLRLWKLTGPLGSETVQSIGFPTGPPWSNGASGDFAPQLQGPPGCQYCSPGPCSPRQIDTGDSRVQNVVYRNGRIWAAHTVFFPTGTPTRSSVQWWQVNPDATVGQRGLVDDATGTRFFAYPSLAVNKNDDVLLGYSRFQGNQYAGASYSFRIAIDPLNTMQPESPLKDGLACYYKDFLLGENRWGDYSATVVDPTDDKTLWTIQEYAAASLGPGQVDDRWGTWWGQLDPTPVLAIADASVSEGNSGTTLLTFPVSLRTSDLSQPLPTSQTVTVQWATANGTATLADNDYVAGSGTVIFAPGETSKTIQVAVNGDLKRELDETLVVNLSSPANVTMPDAQAVGTILNDDAVPQVSVGDVTLVEGSGGAGSPTSFIFPVTLSNPSDTSVTVFWTTANGTAVAGAFGTGDFVGVGLTLLSFPAGAVTRTVTVQVHADGLVEPDEVFYVDLSSPSGATLLRSRGVGRIQDDDATHPGVIGLSILADSVGPGATSGRNRLQWLNPAGAAAASQVHVEYNEGGSCTSPLAVGSGSQSFDVSPLIVGRNSYPHGGRTLDRQYCYSVWIDYGGTYSPRVSLSARPFDSTPPGKVLWKLSTGTTLMAAPTVGVDAVVAVSNDMSVQALERDPASGTGGLWPGSWKPISLGSIAQHRLPVVPLGGGSRAFIATQDGRIHAIDTASGNLIWSTLLPEGAAMGAPAGIFTAFGGAYDYVLVGTSAGTNNHIYALDPNTGAVIDAFPGPTDGAITGMGAILGAATVDYATSRVYFASRRSGAGKSLWCLELGPSPDALRLGWSRDLGSDVDGSPVLRGGRIYVVDNSLAHAAWSIPADTGTGGYSFSLGGSASKGFLFPDRRNGDLYVATDTAVVGLTDTGAALNNKWAPIPLDQPSIALLRPGTNDLFVGVHGYSGNASVLRIDTTTGVVAGNVPLENSQQVVGAPSLDIGYDVIHVGSELGILYAVQLPF
jgi:hypothetical protein